MKTSANEGSQGYIYKEALIVNNRFMESINSVEELKIKSVLKLSHREAIWLDTHGGRSQIDVEKDDEGYYVWMTDGYGDKKVYIPKKEGKNPGINKE